MFAFFSITLFVAVCIAATCSHLHALEVISAGQAWATFAIAMLGWAVGAVLRSWVRPAVLRIYAKLADSGEPVELCILEKHLPHERCTACIPAWIGTAGEKPSRIRAWPTRPVSRAGGCFLVGPDQAQQTMNRQEHDPGLSLGA